MAADVPITAFILPSGMEMVVLLFVGIMLFGRRLPEVGRTVGKTIVHLRQGLYKLKAEMDMDGDIKDVAETFRETRDQWTRAADVPRKLADPGRLFQDLTDESLASLGDEVEEVPDSIFDEPVESENGLSAETAGAEAPPPDLEKLTTPEGVAAPEDSPAPDSRASD